MPDPIPQAEPIPRLAVGPAELAQMLGVSARTVRSWREAGRLPAPTINVGRVQRWAIDELRAWLGAGSPRRSDWEPARDAARRMAAVS